MKKEYLIPLAILVGCGIIGVGVFFGLRSQHPPTTTASSSGQETSSRPAGATTPPVPTVPPQPSVHTTTKPQADQAAAQTHALAAIAKEKVKTFVPKCWDPALKLEPNPAIAKYTFDVTFDAEGREIARGISDDRSAERRDVAICLRELPPSMQIPPPGALVRVELPLTFP